VFDIDGVLVRGDNALPASRRVLSILDGNNPFAVKIPYLLLTNGGGVSESARCHKLSQQLGTKIDPGRFIQAHTVLKSVVHKYADLPVLVLGGKGDALRKVAEGIATALSTLTPPLTCLLGIRLCGRFTVFRLKS